MRSVYDSLDADSPAAHIDIVIVQLIDELCLSCIYEYENDLIDFGMKRQNSFDVTNPAGSSQIDGNPAGSDRIEIDAGLQSLAPHYSPHYVRLIRRPSLLYGHVPSSVMGPKSHTTITISHQ
ncbi:hypothetical protein AVEN_57337-1 [Araneus ventricosus]|uniref:Uncharacterized protein n=1 Tax=Araneus ventricosus TaxID=182803 RepID=A0A4Y2IPF4_ARAVE|nr:hypothetical protein AVEN_57337-1 [Araneus ventricosus]